MANYRGAEGIEFISHGEWCDPELVYDGKSFNYWDIEDALWSMFCEEIVENNIVDGNMYVTVYDIEEHMDKYEPMFDKYVQDNAADYLNDVIFGGYFNN